MSGIQSTRSIPITAVTQQPKEATKKTVTTNATDNRVVAIKK